MDSKNSNEKTQWFVMRDLKRVNAKLPAYKQLENKVFKVFTPLKQDLVVKQGRKKVREARPVIPDLLFVHDTRLVLDPIVEKIPTLQYRYLRNTYREPMTVPEDDMERFIQAVGASESSQYYLPEEITPKMYGRKIRIIDGPLKGYEGNLLSTRGSKVKRLLVELPNILSISVEINPEFIQFVK
ncbi:MAG: UpxY family transcription antiterminator [Dysgonamonadaceae bacterium]|jgi:transcription antitermination factor NusG|nr:UpxY family transcription antiterminator [Dysgonamonadaceae bacterium]